MEMREPFFQAADHLAQLLDDPATAKKWGEASALEHLTVGGLVAHIVQGAVWLDRLLDVPTPGDDVPVITLGDYVSGFKIETREDSESEMHRYVRDLAERGSGRSPEETSTKFRQVVGRLATRLDTQPDDRILDQRPTFPFGMRLDDRVRLEILEFVLHGDDLAVSIGVEDVDPPHEAVTIAIGALLAAPRSRHCDRAVLRALARRERAAPDVFPVL